MKVKIKAVEINFIEDEYEVESPGHALVQFAKDHGGMMVNAVIEYWEIEWPNGKIERVDPRNLKSEILFPTSSLN